MKNIILKSIALITICFSVGFAASSHPRQTKGSASSAGTEVIFTGELAKKVIGYMSTTPVNIHIKNGRIERIEALPNQETPSYFKRATAKVFPQYEGKTVAEARALKPDVATGATYSSEALIKNIQLGLEKAKSPAKSTAKAKKTKTRRK